MNRRYRPMLARESPKPFTNQEWLFEIKWDGFRAIAYVNDELSLKSRNGKELKESFPEIESLKLLTHNVVLDGEIVIVKEEKANFQAMLERRRAFSSVGMERQNRQSPPVYVVFDILEKEGKPLIDLPLIERKKILKESVREGANIIVSDFVEEKGEVYYHAALQKGLEGIMAKKKDSSYQQGVRSSNWLKIKKIRSFDCIIFGYTKGTGTRADTFGALILGLYNKERMPVYVGKVGTGFSQSTLKTLLIEFEQLKTDENPFKTEVDENITWLKPELVAEIYYQTVTSDGRLRMPRFRGLRKDKQPTECTMDQLSTDKLGEYKAKRDFTTTAEPQGEDKKEGEKIFVVQEHNARRLHYDFRLESGGVLKSWAVPNGIPEDSDQKRLAVETEDHPIEYVNFAGTIPKGEYGAGTVKIWDKGSYEPKVWNDNMIEVTLNGQTLKGRYVLVRLKKATREKNWLMLKAAK